MTELTGEQAEAADVIRSWYLNEGGILTLGGYAGTGKTTLLGELKRLLPRGTRVIFTSFTGKAVSVLRSKLPKNAEISTLHRLLYRPKQKTVCIESGEDAIQVGDYRWFCYPHHPTSKPGNGDNEPCEVRKALDWSPVLNPLEDYDLVVVDEASMVSEKLWTDLIRWSVPVLAVGDHGQLPPIRSEFNLMADPQIRLETIMRQAEGNPIIRMATLARTTGHIPIGDYGKACLKVPPYKQSAMLKHLHPENGDLALCSFHRTRTAINAVLRRQTLGSKFIRDEPVVGDIVICGRNSYEAGVFNGQRGIVRTLGPVMELSDLERFAEIELIDEDYTYEGQIAADAFGRQKVSQGDFSRRLGLWDFGYALTVHRSQGSQADRVLVVEERFPRDGDEFHARLLYTAVTRAARSLCVVGPA